MQRAVQRPVVGVGNDADAQGGAEGNNADAEEDNAQQLGFKGKISNTVLHFIITHNYYTQVGL